MRWIQPRLLRSRRCAVLDTERLTVITAAAAMPVWGGKQRQVAVRIPFSTVVAAACLPPQTHRQTGSRPTGIVVYARHRIVRSSSSRMSRSEKRRRKQ